MCRCAERRVAIKSAAGAVLRGDASKIAPAAKFVVKSSTEDLTAAFRAVVRVIRRG